MDKVAEQLLEKMKEEKLSTKIADKNLSEVSGKGSGETEKLQGDLLSISQELQEMKHKLSSTSDDDNAGLSHVTKIIEIHSKIESISITLLNTRVGGKANELTKLVDKLNLEVTSLKQKLEKAKDTEATLKAKVDTAKKAEKNASESLSSLTNQLREKSVMLENAECKNASLEAQLENCLQQDGGCKDVSAGAKVVSLTNCVERLTVLLFEASSNSRKGRKTLLSTRNKLQAAEAQIEDMKLSLKATNEKYENEKKKQREDEWEMKSREFEAKIREANQSAALLMQQNGDLSRSLLVAESRVAALETKSESLEISLGRRKREIESLTSDLETAEVKKEHSVKNEKLATSKVKALTEEKEQLINDLTVSRGKEEECKKKLLSTQTELENAQAQIEKLNLSQNRKGSFEIITRVEQEKWSMSNPSNPIVFLDISTSGAPTGRIIIELFADVSPNMAENFRAFCTGEKGLGLHYKDSLFDEYSSGYFRAGYNVNNGKAINGTTVMDRNFKTVSKPGLIVYYNLGGFGSAFAIRTDNIQPSQVIGIIVEGLHLVPEMEKSGASGKQIKIANCGQLFW